MIPGNRSTRRPLRVPVRTLRNECTFRSDTPPIPAFLGSGALSLIPRAAREPRWSHIVVTVTKPRVEARCIEHQRIELKDEQELTGGEAAVKGLRAECCVVCGPTRHLSARYSHDGGVRKEALLRLRIEILGADQTEPVASKHRCVVPKSERLDGIRTLVNWYANDDGSCIHAPFFHAPRSRSIDVLGERSVYSVGPASAK